MKKLRKFNGNFYNKALHDGVDKKERIERELNLLASKERKCKIFNSPS